MRLMSFSKALYETTQACLAHELRRLRYFEPFGLPLLTLGPFAALACHLQRIDLHIANDRLSALQDFLIGVAADGLIGNPSANTCLFVRFFRCGAFRGDAGLRPAFGDDPASRAARRDQHDLNGLASSPIG